MRFSCLPVCFFGAIFRDKTMTREDWLKMAADVKTGDSGAGEKPSAGLRNGKIRQRLELDKDLDPKVVYASFGWWFPEESANLFEWDRSNVNMLFDTKREEPATGTVEVRGIPCRVSAAKV